MTSFAGFRRREARAVNSGNLRWRDTGPTDVDYIAARGMSGDPLGALLESLKWGNRHQDYAAAVRLLGKRFYERKGRDVLKCLAHTAVREYLDEACRKCGGRAALTDARGILATCPKCNGTGVHQYAEYERAHLSNLAAGSWKKHQKDYEVVLGCLRGAVASHRVGAMMAFGEREEVAA